LLSMIIFIHIKKMCPYKTIQNYQIQSFHLCQNDILRSFNMLQLIH